MTDQLLALRISTYLQNEMDYLPWKSAIKNLEYIQGMLRKTGFYGLLEVFDSYSLNSISYVTVMNIDLSPNDKSELSRDEAYSTWLQHFSPSYSAPSSGCGLPMNLV